MRAARGRRAVRVELERVVLLSHKEARRNRVHANAGTRQIRRQPLGEVGNARLRAGIAGDARQRGERAHRGDVEHTRALLADQQRGHHLAG